MPNIRTVAEVGVPDHDSSTWYGALVRRGTPVEVRGKLADSIAPALRQPDVLQRLQAEGAERSGWRGEPFGRFIATERALG
jgi:tripartite-type tricarboxylate transporter receptor subunit TctC